MPISDTKFETVNVQIHESADFYDTVSSFIQTLRGSGSCKRRSVDFVRAKLDVAVFYVEVDGEHDDIGPIIAKWHADNENSIVEIW